jgi:hypothetical protein
MLAKSPSTYKRISKLPGIAASAWVIASRLKRISGGVLALAKKTQKDSAMHGMNSRNQGTSSAWACHTPATLKRR